MRKAFLLFSIVTLSMAVPRLYITGLVNAGNILFIQSQSSQSSADLNHRWSQRQDSVLNRGALSIFRHATSIAPAAPGVQWGHGRAALSMGMASEAARALSIDDPSLAENAPRYLDTLIAHSHAEEDKEVVSLFEDIPPPRIAQVISDTVALSYLREAQHALERGSEDRAIEALKRAAALRPGDLYANYYLWKQATRFGDNEEATHYRKQLTDFPAEAVSLRHEGLLEMIFEVFPRLLSDGIWTQARGENIVAYWVWQNPQAFQVMDLVQDLAQRFPLEPSWHFYLAELYHRVGKLELAKQSYQQFLTLGGDAVLGEKRLARLDSELRGSHMAYCGVADRVQPGDDALIAGILKVPADTVKLSENLVKGDTFTDLSIETLDTPRATPVEYLIEGELWAGFGPKSPSGWYYQVNPGDRLWQFSAGRDDFECPGSMRITNLWWPDGEHETDGNPYASYIGNWFSTSSKWLMVSLWYRVEGKPTDIGLMFVGDGHGGPEQWLSHTRLPNTSGAWQRLVVVGRTPAATQLISGLRNWGAASIWFRDFAVRNVDIEGVPMACTEKPCEQFFASERHP